MPKSVSKNTKPVGRALEKEVSILSGGEVKAKKDKTPVSAKATATEVRASLRYLRMSPKKVRLVTGAIKGLPVNEALNRLQLMSKLASRDVGKLLRSALANAEHNFKLNKEDLYVKSAVANDGPVLKRYLPAAFGTAHPIKKRSCHIEVILAVKEDKESGLKNKELRIKDKKSNKHNS